jgi:hypothetical protein
MNSETAVAQWRETTQNWIIEYQFKILDVALEMTECEFEVILSWKRPNRTQDNWLRIFHRVRLIPATLRHRIKDLLALRHPGSFRWFKITTMWTRIMHICTIGEVRYLTPICRWTWGSRVFPHPRRFLGCDLSNRIEIRSSWRWHVVSRSNCWFKGQLSGQFGKMNEHNSRSWNNASVYVHRRE